MTLLPVEQSGEHVGLVQIDDAAGSVWPGSTSLAKI